ncbi:MAG: Gfo/Idh/MocA family oxidoreductase [Chthonomonadales bacterium]
MSLQSSRREFLRNAAFAGAGAIVAGGASAEESKRIRGKGPGELVNFACIGVGGKGDSDAAEANRLGKIVAICDVSDANIAAALKKYPGVKVFHDYRKMLDEMGKDIDAVTVSTPDHHHAIAASMAMSMGKACFCQKPLAHSIYEARHLGELAKKMKVATQMGNQGTSGNGLRKASAQIRAGRIGKVSEVHVWTNRPIWPQGGVRGAKMDVPAGLDWEQWLGPAPERPYSTNYAPFAWRGWWDFGTGALGDMACHTVNLPFMALDLRNPTSVVATSSGNNKDSYPSASKITYQFPANKDRGPITMYWYDGGNMPPKEIMDPVLDGLKPSTSACIIVGEKAKVYSPGDYGQTNFFVGLADEANPEVDYPHSPGHVEEFILSIKEGKPAMSNFAEYAGPLTETILLGNLAVWAEGKKIDWDAKNLKARNAPEVSNIIKPTYRKGFSLK